MIISESILKKHEIGIEAARKYYILGQPTGFSDDYYTNVLEAEARKDGLELRDYVFQEIAGTRFPNASYIGKVEKEQVPGDMYTCIQEYYQWYTQTYHEEPVFLLKYDGSSLVAYYDPETGKVAHVVTAGGTNRTSEGIDWTGKFSKYFPETPGTGICAIQAECLVALEHGFGETSRQKANGLVNSAINPKSMSEFLSVNSKRTKKDYGKYLKKFEVNLKEVQKDIDDHIGIRGFRCFFAGPCKNNYWETFMNIPCVYNSQRDPKFAPAMVMTFQDLMSLGPEVVNKDIWKTPTGTFMVDGIVVYSQAGSCVKALKYRDAGRGESVKVDHIEWVDQRKKGKDSWSPVAHLVNPVEIRGSKIKKLSVGGVKRMVSEGITKDSLVTVILANSTIPMVDKVIQSGSPDYEWPKCSCGYQTSEKDIFGLSLKCGNPECTEREARMKKYLGENPVLDLNKLLVIDRFDWSKKILDPKSFWENFWNKNTKEDLEKYLASFMTTDLQKRNLGLVIGPAWRALHDNQTTK